MVVLLLLLVLLLPTLLSTAPARSIALGIVNKELNGKMEIDSWSLGWFTGISADGIHVTDAAGAKLADLQHVHTQLSLLRVLRGDYDLGKTTIDGLVFDLKQDATGQWNYATLTKPSTEKPSSTTSASTAKSSKLPNVAGDITVTNVHGTVEQAGQPTLAVSDLTASANIPNINSKITDALNITLQVNNVPAGSIALSGTAQAVKENELAIASAAVHQTLDLNNIDLQTFAPLLPANLGIKSLTGGSHAHFVVDLSGTAPGAPAGVVGNTLTVAESSLVVEHLHLSKLTSAGTEVAVLNDEALNYAATAVVNLAATSPTATPALSAFSITGLTLKDAQNLIAVAQTGTLTVSGANASGGTITVHSDAAAVSRVAQAWTASPTAAATSGSGLRSGVLDLTIQPGDITGKNAGTNGVLADGAVSNLVITQDGKPTTQPQTIQLHAAAAISADQKTLQLADANVKSQFATLDLSNAAVQLGAATLFDKLQSATLAVDVPDLKSLQQLADAFSPQTISPNTPATQPAAAPLQLTAGSLSLHSTVSHDADVLVATLSNLDVTNVTFTRGPVSSTLKPVHAQLSARILPLSTPPAGAGMMQQIQQIQVSTLAADLGVATLSMSSPITLSNLGQKTAPTAAGAIKIDGKLDDLCPELAALQGEPADALPYRGTLTATQTLKSDNTGLSADGGLQIAHFQVLNGSAVTFSEDLLDVANSLTAAADLNSLKIANFSASMKSSGAMGLVVQNGTVDDLAKARKLSLTAQLNYDLAKLWPIIHPMLLTPGKPDSYADVKLAGVYQKTFHINGAYPAGVPSTTAIAQLVLDGDLAVDDFEHSGLTVQKLEVPFLVQGGTLVTAYVGKPSGQNTAPPAVANGGQLDLGNYLIDLKQSPPRLNTLQPNKQLLTNVTINPLFSRSFLAKIINNPVFAGAQQATGLFSLTVADCSNFPLGNLATQRVPANTGQIDLTFSLTDMQIGLQGLSQVASALHQDSFNANVKNGTLKIAGGLCTENLTFQTGSYNLGFNGVVALDTEEMMPVTVTFPLGAAVKAATGDQNVSQYVPDSAPVVMTGPITAPRLQLNQLISKTVSQAGTKAALGKFVPGLGGGSGGGANNTATSKPVDQQVQDLGNQLFNAFGKKKH